MRDQLEKLRDNSNTNIENRKIEGFKKEDTDDVTTRMAKCMNMVAHSARQALLACE